MERRSICFTFVACVNSFPTRCSSTFVRNVTSVVRSMLNFHRIAGVSLVASEQEAYDYWFRAVSAYLLAEQAYGLGVVFRLRYSELVDQPEASLRSLRNFLGEPFAAGCLIPSEKESTVPMYPLISSLATPTPIQQSSSVRRNFTPKSKRLRSRQRHQLPRATK